MKNFSLTNRFNTIHLLSLLIIVSGIFLLTWCTYTNNMVKTTPYVPDSSIIPDKLVKPNIVEPLPIVEPPISFDVIQSNNSTFGKIFTDWKGMTLYTFSKDTKGVSNCYDTCAVNWPPLITNGNPNIDSSLISSKFSTITRTDWKKQVTFEDLPLYYFIKDINPGDTKWQGLQWVWMIYKVEDDDLKAASIISSIAQPSEHNNIQVDISNFMFNPGDIIIKSWDTVTWINKDQAIHQIGFTNWLEEIKSNVLNKGDSFSYTFNNSWTIKYICPFHPKMQWMIVIN